MPGKSKKGGGLEVGSSYKMKYQGTHSAFPFKSPMKKDEEKEKEQEEQLNEFGETRAEYIARLKKMGLRNDTDSKTEEKEK